MNDTSNRFDKRCDNVRCIRPSHFSFLIKKPKKEDTHNVFDQRESHGKYARDNEQPFECNETVENNENITRKHVSKNGCMILFYV